MRALIIAIIAIASAILLIPAATVADDTQDLDQEPVELGALLDREYSWMHDGQMYTLSMQISADDYATATAVDRGTTTLSSYERYITPDCPAVRGLADAFVALGGDPALMTLSMVQSIDYRTDMAGYGLEEYPAYPIETLVNGYGDCEDTAALYVSVMQALGRDAALIAMLDTPIGGHMAAGIAGPYQGTSIEHDGITYYYAETTTHLPLGNAPAAIEWDPAKANVLGAML